MRQLSWKLVLPLTIISFATITKWWYAVPIDAPNTLYSGFPFPFVGDGWHTSMSFQIFILEFLADFLIYFSFWFIVVFSINRFLTKINVHKFVSVGLLAISGLIIFGATYIVSFSENIFHFKRPYEMEVIKTGYKLAWQQIEHPESNNKK